MVLFPGKRQRHTIPRGLRGESWWRSSAANEPCYPADLRRHYGAQHLKLVNFPQLLVRRAGKICDESAGNELSLGSVSVISL